MEADGLEATHKQVKIRMETHRRMRLHLSARDMMGDKNIPHKQDFVSDAVDEKIDREEAKAARRQREGGA